MWRWLWFGGMGERWRIRRFTGKMAEKGYTIENWPNTIQNQWKSIHLETN